MQNTKTKKTEIHLNQPPRGPSSHNAENHQTLIVSLFSTVTCSILPPFQTYDPSFLTFVCVSFHVPLLMSFLCSDFSLGVFVQAFGDVFVYALQALYDSQTRILESLPL